MSDPVLLRIQMGRYSARIALEGLHSLPRRNARKLLRLPHDPRNLYAGEAADLRDRLVAKTAEAERAWLDAGRDFTNGWRYVANKRSRTEENRAILAENRRLKAAVKRAKANYDHWKAVTALHDEELKGCMYHERDYDYHR